MAQHTTNNNTRGHPPQETTHTATQKFSPSGAPPIQPVQQPRDHHPLVRVNVHTVPVRGRAREEPITSSLHLLLSEEPGTTANVGVKNEG